MTLHARSLTAAFAFLAGALVTEAFRDGGALLGQLLAWREQGR